MQVFEAGPKNPANTPLTGMSDSETIKTGRLCGFGLHIFEYLTNSMKSFYDYKLNVVVKLNPAQPHFIKIIRLLSLLFQTCMINA